MDEQATAKETPSRALWIIRGNAYDLSGWASKHPGGSLIIEQTAGTDCTALFESYHALTDKPVHGMLKGYLVRPAEVDEQDASVMWPWDSTPVYDELKKRVKAHLAGKSTKAPTWQLATWYVFWLTTWTYNFWSWVTQGRLHNAIIFGFSLWYLSGDACHSGAHYAIFASPRLNLFVAYAFGWLHATPAAWIRQHNIGHHAFTNTAKDPDLTHHDMSMAGHIGWRDHADQTWYSNMQYWRWFEMPFATLTGVVPLLMESTFWLMQDVSATLKEWNVYPTSVVLPWERVLSCFQMCLIVTLMSIVGYTHGIIIAAIPFAVHGMMYHYNTQLTHINEESQKLVQGEEWAIHQVRCASGDWGQRSRLAGFFSVGLNMQGPHHIFPSLHWIHYRTVYRILQEVLGETLPETLAERTFAEAHVNWKNHIDSLNSAWKDQPSEKSENVPSGE